MTRQTARISPLFQPQRYIWDEDPCRRHVHLSPICCKSRRTHQTITKQRATKTTDLRYSIYLEIPSCQIWGDDVDDVDSLPHPESRHCCQYCMSGRQSTHKRHRSFYCCTCSSACTIGLKSPVCSSLLRSWRAPSTSMWACVIVLLCNVVNMVLVRWAQWDCAI